MGGAWGWYGVCCVCVCDGGGRDGSSASQAGRYVKFLREYQGNLRTLLSFMLVFFYQQIYNRAKQIFWNLPWPDEVLFMCNGIIGAHEHDALPGTEAAQQKTVGKTLRRTIARYILASCFIVCHSSSAKFQKTYPGPPLSSMVELGLLTQQETLLIKQRQDKLPYLSELHFIPTVWAQYVMRDAVNAGAFLGAGGGAGSDFSMVARLQESLRSFRSGCATLLFSNYLPFPVLLSQVVTIMCYGATPHPPARISSRGACLVHSIVHAGPH